MWCFLQGSMNEKLFKVSLHMETIHLLFWRAYEDFKGVLVTVNVSILSYGKFECQRNYFGTSSLFKK